MKMLVLGDAASANVKSFVSGLEEVGVKVVLASLAPGGHVRLEGGRRWGLARYAIAGIAARRIHRQLSPDLVVGYFASGYGLSARLSGGSPLVQVVAGSDVLAMKGRWIAGRLTRGNLQEADLVIAWSDELADIVRRWGVADERILTQCRGVDTEVFRPPYRPVEVPSLVTTRTLARKYRHDVVLRALADIPDVPLTFVGDGPEGPTLRALAKELGIGERIRFVGELSPSDLAAELRRHSIYVSATATDGVSASLLEAMACGLFPVVVQNRSNEAWVGGDQGVLHDGTVAGVRGAITEAVGSAARRSEAFSLNRRVVLSRGDRSRNMRVIVARLGVLTR